MRHIFLGCLGLVVSFVPVVSAQSCFETASIPDGRRIDLELLSRNSAFILGEAPLPEEARAQVLSFIDKPESADTATARQVMFYKQSAALKDRREDLETLRYLMSGQRPLSFVAINLHDKSFLDVQAEATEMMRKMAMKHLNHALCLKMGTSADQCSPDVSDKESTDLMLLAVGPVIFLSLTEPNLFDNVKVAATNIENLHHIALGDKPQPDLAGDGDMAFVLDTSEVPGVAADLTTICKKARPEVVAESVSASPTGPIAKASASAKAPVVKSPVVKALVAPTPKRSHRMVAYQHRAFYVQPPRHGREYLTIRGIRLNVWYSHDKLGRVYRHWGKYSPFNWRHPHRHR